MFGREKLQRPLSPSATPFRVVDVFPDNIDDAGRKMVEVYVKRQDFAIYLAEVARWQKVRARMIVQFADDPETHKKQVLLIDDLLPLRDKLEYLCDDLKNAIFYQRRLATALQLTLDGKQETALQDMKTLINYASQERVGVGRRIYLQWAIPIALISGAVLIAIGGCLRGGAAPTGAVLLSGGGGALGAILSIALAFSDRSVAPDHDILTNALDGAVRVLIGIISGATINLFLSAGFLTHIFPLGGVTDQALAGGKVLAASWGASLAIGIVAGFLERFVPDLITKFGSEQPGAQAPERGNVSVTSGTSAPAAAPASSSTKPVLEPAAPIISLPNVGRADGDCS